MSSRTSSKNYIVFFGLIILIAIFAVGVPIFPVYVEETYEVTVPYESQESYEEMEDKSEVILDQTFPHSISGGYYRHVDLQIKEGTQITFTYRASMPIEVYIFTDEQYLFWNSIGGDIALVKESGSSGTLTYTSLLGGLHHFVFSNEHSIDVSLKSSKITLEWSELVTKERPVTEYRIETRTRQVQKRVTLISKLLQTYN
jgi:hypothetical protein